MYMLGSWDYTKHKSTVQKAQFILNLKNDIYFLKELLGFRLFLVLFFCFYKVQNNFSRNKTLTQVALSLLNSTSY